MDSLSDTPPRCPVCGLPLQRWPDPDERGTWEAEMHRLTYWWGDITLLCDPEDYVGSMNPDMQYEAMCRITPKKLEKVDDALWRSKDLKVYPGTWLEGSYFQRVESDGMLNKVRVGKADAEQESVNKHLHIPLHTSCYNIAQELFNSVLDTPSQIVASYIKDTHGLFLALRWRISAYHQFADLVRQVPPNYDPGRADYRAFTSDEIFNNDPKPRKAWPGPSEDSRLNRRDVSNTESLPEHSPYVSSFLQ